QRACDIDCACGFWVEASAGGEAARPVEQGAAAPGVGRAGESFTGGAVEALDDEVVEGAVDVAEREAAAGAEERGLDDGVAAGVQIPGACEPDIGTAVDPDERV